MRFNALKIISITAFLGALLVSPAVFAETDELQAVKDESSELQQQLKEIENQITQYKKDIANIQGQKKTYQRKLDELAKQRATLNLQIEASIILIDDLEKKMSEVKSQLDQAEVKSEEIKEHVAEIIRKIYKYDSTSFLIIFFSKNSLGESIREIQDYQKLDQNLKIYLEANLENQGKLVEHKENLNDKQENIQNLINIKSIQNDELADTATQQSELLKEAKIKEIEDTKTLAEKKKIVTEIKSRIYELFNAGEKINFEKAVSIAQWASEQTGVRTAFLLAILTQESNLGKNVGTCNRPGDPARKSWKNIMKPTRDQEPFLLITKELGLNPDITPVSCPMFNKDGSQFGWGGAMGPAQFIPSTWIGYRDKVTNITGKSANPWDIRDAFIASALLLKANGAGTKSGEHDAALRYFSGGTNPVYSFYADSVLKIAQKYQEDIDSIGQN